MKKTFWISYDLNLKGDYPGLYSWLDAIGAKECGDSIAFISKEYPDDDDFIEALKKEIQENIQINKSDRIYLIHFDDKTEKIKGRYLFGNRKRAPWEGFAPESHGIIEDIG